MKILLVSQNFSPELTGIGKYSGEMAESLVDAGHEVTVVCAPPYYPAWRLGAPNAYRCEHPRPGLRVLRCPLWVPRRLGAARRALHLLSFALAALPVLLGQALRRPDVVLCVVPSFATAPASWLAARLAGAATWLHVQDFEFDAAFGVGMVRGSRLRGLLEGIERFVMRRFDRVSTISGRMARRLLAKGVDAARIEELPNWVDVRAIRPEGAPTAFRQALADEPGRTVFLFSGTMNRKQGLDALLDAFDAIDPATSSRMLLVLCGEGEMKPMVEQRARGRANVQVLPLQPLEQLNALLNAADVHVLPQVPGAADLVMPSKLGAMLASGRPVIATAAPGTEIAAVVEGRGWCVEPGDARALAAAMVRAHEACDERAQLGRRARDYAVETLDRQLVIGRLGTRLALLRAPAGAPTVPADTALL